jgi:hypothetical protein
VVRILILQILLPESCTKHWPFHLFLNYHYLLFLCKYNTVLIFVTYFVNKLYILSVYSVPSSHVCVLLCFELSTYPSHPYSNGVHVCKSEYRSTKFHQCYLEALVVTYSKPTSYFAPHVDLQRVSYVDTTWTPPPQPLSQTWYWSVPRYPCSSDISIYVNIIWCCTLIWK